MTESLQWKRTGLICLRSEPYLIERLITRYVALYGQPCARQTLGEYPYTPDTMVAAREAAKAACEAHRLATDEKNPEAT